MDIALCRLNVKTNQIIYAGAQRPLLIICDEQKSFFHQTIENWRGNNEQVDDILLKGIKVA